MQTKVLTTGDVRDIVQRVGLDALMDETIERLTEAFLRFDPAEIVVPARDGFQYQVPDMGLIEWMPCMRTGDSAHIKVVGYHPNNGVHHELPTILSTLSMYGVHDGHLRGVMDATFITALRTGAASAVASRILALPEASSLGLIGCGAQAVSQLHALSRVFSLTDVHVYDTDSMAMESFAGRAACLGLENIRIRRGLPGDFLTYVDVLCTATSVGINEGPVFHGSGFRSHLHVNAVGSDLPGKIELPADLLSQSLVCPDFADQARKEGECQQLEPRQIGPDIHTLVKDQACYASARGRYSVFDSTGWALEDMVCMDMFMEYADRFGIGTQLELETVSSDYLNPYQFIFDTPAQASLQNTDRDLKRVI